MSSPLVVTPARHQWSELLTNVAEMHVQLVQHFEDVRASDVRRVAVILSASRSGSSALYEAICSSGETIRLAGEHVPHVKLASGWADEGQSDQLTPTDRRLDVGLVARLVLLEARLSGPQQKFRQPADVRVVSGQISERLRAVFRASSIGATSDALRAVTGPAPTSVGPFLEEPPFVEPFYGAVPTRRDYEERLLVLKAPVDAYRPRFWERVFPRAAVQYVYLSRDAGPSVGGLIDGWNSADGFFSHRMQTHAMTDLSGYTHASTGLWNFDLPPEWTGALPGGQLADVCTFQWLSAHRAIQQQLEQQPHYLLVRYEDMLDADRAASTFHRLGRHLGLTDAAGARMRLPVAAVMATGPIDKDRWRRHASAVLPALNRQPVAEMRAELGYQ